MDRGLPIHLLPTCCTLAIGFPSLRLLLAILLMQKLDVYILAIHDASVTMIAIAWEAVFLYHGHKGALKVPASTFHL